MKRTGKIHYAKLENSPRLQRLLSFLKDGRDHSTRDIIYGADICAINTAVDELRENLKDEGLTVRCRPANGLYLYRLEMI